MLGSCKTGTTTMTNILQNDLNYTTSAHTWSYYPLWNYFQSDSWFALSTAVDDLSWVSQSPFCVDKFLKAIQRSNVFADSPWNYLWPIYEQLVPPNKSKYILTVRDSTRDVLNSNAKMLLTRKEPTKNHAHFKNAKTGHTKHGNWNDLWHLMARQYEKHIENVLRYFTSHNRMDDLLIINLKTESQKDSFRAQWDEITTFLGCPPITNRGLSHSNAAIKTQADFFPTNYVFDWRSYSWPVEWQ